MNRLAEEHIHLLIDEPIYVLEDHGDHPTIQYVAEKEPEYTGANEKGICIFAEEPSDDDLTFLFKGLNALNIEAKDVAIFRTDYEATRDYPDHNHRLRFSEQISLAATFKLNQKNNLIVLDCLPLEKIRNNQDFKRQFWEALKLIFKDNA